MLDSPRQSENIDLCQSSALRSLEIPNKHLVYRKLQTSTKVKEHTKEWPHKTTAQSFRSLCVQYIRIVQTITICELSAMASCPFS